MTVKRIARHALAAVILALSVAAPAAAGDLKADIEKVTALHAYQSGDYATARRILRPLADQGDAVAQSRLGDLYARGQGVSQDYVAAVSWYRKAADQGAADAQSSLGFRYSLGEGVPQDYVLAHMWLNLSAAKGDEYAAKARDMVAAKMTPQQIAEAQKMAREWKPK
jgi:TPR repeat protein